MENWWNKMDALATQPATHDIGISPETQQYPDYGRPDADLYPCPSIHNK